MTYGGADEGNLSQSREAARQKSKALRHQHKKRERGRRYLLRGSIIIVSLAVIAVVTLVIINTVRPAGPGPRNMLSDGIKIGKNYAVTPTAALAADATPVPNKLATGSDVVDIQIYTDYYCPFCKAFEATNSDQMESWLNHGSATVEIHPISVLNPNSQGTQYSTRSANAAACVANYSPKSYWEVNKALLAKQPKVRTAGLSDDQLIAILNDTGVSNDDKIAQCVRDQTFKRWVQAATLRALEGPIPNSTETVGGPPTILVNGVKYKGGVEDADAFATFVLQAAGQTFSEQATATPTPTPTATPTPTRKPTATSTATPKA
ncbi:thioredoxin domain-containing protein [Glaciihabitans sp. dw_435]|uniref:DsbA family protein n=1 Tax=Glaciihabitans sp. dw_435 TaxID=2720081 RepID=UPI001BD2576E|nr:thioredoxin domain-containing protein [Glaciihabitans sp. dw_435]